MFQSCSSHVPVTNQSRMGWIVASSRICPSSGWNKIRVLPTTKSIGLATPNCQWPYPQINIYIYIYLILYIHGYTYVLLLIMWLKHVKTIINHLIFDGLYHPCMVILGIVHYCFNHITFCLNTSSLLGSSNRLTSPSSMWINDLNVVETIIDLLEDNVMMSCDICFSRYSTTVSLKKKDHIITI